MELKIAAFSATRTLIYTLYTTNLPHAVC